MFGEVGGLNLSIHFTFSKPFKMFQTIIALLKETLGFAGQIAENKGLKIPLRESEIRQRANNNAERLKRKGYVAEESFKWIETVKSLSYFLRPLQSKHAKNQVRDLVGSQADILKIHIEERQVGKRTGNWLVIEYMRDDYKREYLIEAK